MSDGHPIFVVRSTGICPLGRASKRRQASCVFQTFKYGRFSREPACNYVARATIYDKTKKGNLVREFLFRGAVVRSGSDGIARDERPGIEDIRRYEKSLDFQGFFAVERQRGRQNFLGKV